MFELTYVVNARGIPTIPLAATEPKLRLSNFKSIIIDSRFAESANTNGETLIPPSLQEFADTFAQDLGDLGINVSCHVGDTAVNGSIFLSLGDPADYLDVAGRESAEGYSLSVSNSEISIVGASSLGAWWGTRSVLQQVSSCHHFSIGCIANDVGCLKQWFHSIWCLRGHPRLGNKGHDD